MREIKEAEFWLSSAKYLRDIESQDRRRYTVIVAQCIHSIIKANDALTIKFLNRRAFRHDDAPQLFLRLVQLNKIPAKFSNLRTTILTPAVQLKSKADYKGIEVSKAETEKMDQKRRKVLKQRYRVFRAIGLTERSWLLL